MLKKGKAIIMMALNLRTIIKIPKFIQQAVEEIKSDYEELKEAIENLKKNFRYVEADVQKCITDGKDTPTDCFSNLFGGIKYS